MLVMALMPEGSAKSESSFHAFMNWFESLYAPRFDDSGLQSMY